MVQRARGYGGTTLEVYGCELGIGKGSTLRWGSEAKVIRHAKQSGSSELDMTSNVQNRGEGATCGSKA
jgi:hypothetical protein